MSRSVSWWSSGRVPGRQVEAGGDREVPCIWDHVFSVWNPYVGGSVEAGTLGESVGVQAGLEEPCFLFLRTETRFLGGFVEGVGHRVSSASSGLLRMGRLQRGRRSAQEPGCTTGTACLGQRRGCGGGVAGPFE